MAAKVVLGSWCYTRRNRQRCSQRKAAQFQGIPSGVTPGTNSPEGSGGDPWVLVLYQEDGDSGDPSERRLDSRWQLDSRRQQGVMVRLGIRHLYQGSVNGGKH